VSLTFYTVAETAPILRVTEYEVSKLCRTGRLRASKPGRSWLIAESDLLEFIAAHSNQQPAGGAA
jgi:excisionase family DNA binding protein